MSARRGEETLRVFDLEGPALVETIELHHQPGGIGLRMGP